MLTPQQRADWEENGFVVLRSFADPAIGEKMAAETIAAIRSDPPAAHAGEQAYVTAQELLIQPEAKQPRDAVQPEDFVSKVFQTHLHGTARDFALSDKCAQVVSDLLGGNIDVFQSMFILKNRGAWGQPWHQDSFYFHFDRQPQVGLWLAISEATLENGCLSVLPGSHRQDVLPHIPDRREGANQGYQEILGVDESAAVPVLMQPGDLLVFDSYLLHKSVDNVADGARMAMVYHYGRAGTKNLALPELLAVQERVTRWVPVRRAT